MEAERICRKKTLSVDRKADALKKKLASTDDKVMECIEAFLAGEALPHDMIALYSERQLLREKTTIERRE